uniref:Tyrosine-protein kinase ephrin type A/B receptor-like domain-containing protein n=1 Tax=Plectus sambesii TaxID=2011161 RepID=A0A914X5D4_9BILA
MLMNRVFTRAPECTADDFNYEYTSCDASGERWRVAVPRPGRVCEGNVPFPQKGLNCSFSCSGGQYLDLKTQECRHCQAGSYSLGGGVRFEDFTDLPQGFQIENFALDGDEILAEVGVVAQTAAASTDCAKNGGWHVKDGFLIYVPTPCFSKLSYSGHLVRPGFVEYVYRMPKNNLGLVFNVIVKNEQCQSYRDQLKALMGETRDRSGSSKSGANGEWQTGRLELKSGPNVISWTVANSRESAGNLDPIVIGHIDVHGIAFTKSCTLCPAGTYSSDGATECTPCQPDHYSKRGTPQSCPKCPDEQYSGPKASSCIDRPKCTESDYYAVHEPCVDGKTKKSFKSVQPKVCRDDLPGAVKQPHSEPPIPCPKCNPGMHLNKEGACVFCDKDQYSDGNECTKCPVNTVPNYGYQYVWWNSLPPNMKTNCEFIDEESTSDCNIGEAWLPDGESIHTAPTHQPGVALELALAVPHGFKNPLVGTDVRISAQNPIGHLTFVFETRCATKDCALYFVEDSAEGNGFYRMVADFNGTVLKRAYTHPITRITGVKYMWAFLRSKSSAVDEFIADRATIYSINVTNAVAGGASACLPCPTSANPNKGCVPCEPGHYMTESTHICTKCPKDTMLNTTGDRIGVKSCIECGDYLASNDGVACTTDGNLLLTIGKNETRKYDMSALGGKRTYEASGVKVYSREGTSYYHMFNVSLFGGTATCRDTYDYKGDALIKAAALDETTEAAVCRMTVLPLREGNTSHMIYVSPMGLVSRLIGISHKPEHQNIRLGEKELDY